MLLSKGWILFGWYFASLMVLRPTLDCGAQDSCKLLMNDGGIVLCFPYYTPTRPAQTATEPTSGYVGACLSPV